MSNVFDNHIEQLRQYFSSTIESEKYNILLNLPIDIVEGIKKIKDGFLNNISIEEIAISIESVEYVLELTTLRNTYLSQLASNYLDNTNNLEAEMLLSSNNVLFRELLTEISEQHSFEKDLSNAIKLTERENLKNLLKKLDIRDDFNLTDYEMKIAISQVERQAIKDQFTASDKSVKIISLKPYARFAAAAIFIGMIVIGSYLSIKNKDNSKYQFDSKGTKSTSLVFPTIQQKEQKIKLTLQKNDIKLIVDSIVFNVIIKNVGKQIDTLQKMYFNEGYDSSAKTQIHTQIEFLKAVSNTYTYDLANKTIVLNLSNPDIIVNILSTNGSDLSYLYIKLKETFYKLIASDTENKLVVSPNLK